MLHHKEQPALVRSTDTSYTLEHPPAERLPRFPNKCQENEEDSTDEEDTGYHPHNRGNKLKRFAAGVASLQRASGQRLWASHLAEEQMEVVKIGKCRAIVKRSTNKRQLYDRFEPDEDPYAGISLEEILAPPEKPADVLYRKQYRRTLKSPRLDTLSSHAMSMIETEASLNRLLKRATYMIQRDDPATRDLQLEKGTFPENGGTNEGHHEENEEELWNKARDALQNAVSASNEIILRLTAARSRLTRAQSQKVYLYKSLKESEAKKKSLKRSIGQAVPDAATADSENMKQRGSRIRRKTNPVG